MTETKKAIIELIDPFMNKSLSEGCLINIHKWECKVIQFTGSNLKVWGYRANRYLNYKYPDHIGELDNKDNFEIIGHYDATSIELYIHNKLIEYSEIIIKDGYKYFLNTNLGDIKFPHKPIHLYTEEEDKNLLELLQKLGKIN